MVYFVEDFFRISIHHIGLSVRKKESKMCCLRIARLVTVREVLKPCCSLISLLFIKGVNLSLIILLNIFGIIKILDIGQ